MKTSSFKTPPIKGLLTGSALLLWAYSGWVHALGLSELTASSYLGQPLAATIRITNNTEGYLPEELIIRQLSPDQARKLGIDLAGNGQRFRLRLQQQSDQLVIQLTSRNPVDEPFLDLVIELKWPSGTVYREYTLLLDPPGFSGQLPPTSSATAAVPEAPVESSLPPPVKSTENLSAGSQRYRVVSGDSLSKIAARLVSSSAVSKDDMMNWLLSNNPAAFRNGDMNRLLAGKQLILPSGSDLAKAMSDRRVEQRQPVADIASPEPKAEQNSSGTAAPKEPAKSVERLTIVTPGASRSSVSPEELSQAETILALRDTVVATQELADRLKRDNEIMQKRLEAIERSGYLESLERLVQLKEEEILALKTQLQTSRMSAPAVDGTAGSSQGSSLGQKLADRWWLVLLLVLAALGALVFFYRWKLTESPAKARSRAAVNDQRLLDELDAMASPSRAKLTEAANSADQRARQAIEYTRQGFKDLGEKITSSDKRSEAEIKASIKQKTEEYIPVILEGRNESDYDALDQLISEALGAANRGNFGVAEAMLLAERAEQVRKPVRRENDGDSRLEAAIEYVEQMRQIKYSQHFKN